MEAICVFLSGCANAIRVLTWLRPPPPPPPASLATPPPSPQPPPPIVNLSNVRVENGSNLTIVVSPTIKPDDLPAADGEPKRPPE